MKTLFAALYFFALSLLPSSIDPQAAAVIDKALSFEMIAASFRMVRTVPVITGQIESEGSMELYADGRLHWRNASGGYVFFTDGTDAYVEKADERYAVPQAFSSVFSMVADALGDDAGGRKSLFEGGRMFSASFVSIDQDRLGMELVPSRGAMSSFISKIDIVLSVADAVVEEVNIITANGSVTRIIFYDVVRTPAACFD